MTIAKVKVTEVKDGQTYKGTIAIGKTTLEYSLSMSANFNDLDKRHLSPQQTLGEATIEVRSKGKRIQITNDEKGFVFGYAGSVAMNLFKSAQRDDLRTGFDTNNVIDLHLRRLNSDGEVAPNGEVYAPLKSEIGFEQDLPIDTTHPIVSGLLRRAS